MKKIHNVIILLIIINIAIFIYLLVIPKVKTYEYIDYALEQDNIKRQNGELEETNAVTPVRDNIISFENENILLSNYKGEIPTGYVNVKFTDLLNGGFEKLYNDTKGMNNTSLENYLKENSNDIAMQTGITNANDFAKFIQKIQIYKDQNIKCETIEIIEDSYANGSEYDYFRVQLSYDNGQAVIFDVYLSNNDFIDTPIIVIM